MRGLYSWITGEGAVGFWLRCLAGLGLTFALPCAVFPKEQSQLDTHIQLIRGLLREVAVSKVPLPRGKKGVRVDPQGKLDKADADSQLSAQGMAIKAGMPVEISKITLSPRRLCLRLTAAGKSPASGTSTSR